MTGHLAGFFKLRVGDYRVIYDFNTDEKIITIDRIGHRREIYTDLETMFRVLVAAVQQLVNILSKGLAHAVHASQLPIHVAGWTAVYRDTWRGSLHCL